MTRLPGIGTLRRCWASVIARIGRAGRRRRTMAGRARALGAALLAAVVAHALLLSHGGAMRAARPGATAAPPPGPDDTPELLRFSRRAAMEPAPIAVLPPPPPPELPPPPAATTAAPPGRVVPPASAAPGPVRRSSRRPGGPAGRRPADGRVGSGRGQRPAGRRPAAATGGAAAASSSMPLRLVEARQGLEALARRPDGEEDGRSLSPQKLWEQATPVDSAELPQGLELRRLPAAAVLDLGLGDGTRWLSWTESRPLLLWLEGDQAWLLRGSPAPDGAPGRGPGPG